LPSRQVSTAWIAELTSTPLADPRPTSRPITNTLSPQSISRSASNLYWSKFSSQCPQASRTPA
jgi:hypothetical protein